MKNQWLSHWLASLKTTSKFQDDASLFSENEFWIVVKPGHAMFIEYIFYSKEC